MDLKESSILGENIYSHWYYTSKGRAVRKFLGDVATTEVLDVGAGSGIFSRQILDAGICESAVCLDPNYSDETTENYNGKQIRFVQGVEKIPQKLILLMDVLEHIPDDLAFIKNYAAKIEPGGHLFITVPTFQFMWSGHDVFLEHQKRYTIGEIESLIKNAGLIPVKSRYFFGILFPVVTAVRLIKKFLFRYGALKPQSDLKTYSNWFNKGLIGIHDLERCTFFNMNKFFGLSLFCLCRKLPPTD